MSSRRALQALSFVGFYSYISVDTPAPPKNTIRLDSFTHVCNFSSFCSSIRLNSFRHGFLVTALNGAACVFVFSKGRRHYSSFSERICTPSRSCAICRSAPKSASEHSPASESVSSPRRMIACK